MKMPLILLLLVAAASAFVHHFDHSMFARPEKTCGGLLIRRVDRICPNLNYTYKIEWELMDNCCEVVCEDQWIKETFCRAPRFNFFGPSFKALERSCGPKLFTRVKTVCGEDINVDNKVKISDHCCTPEGGCTDDWIKENVCKQTRFNFFRQFLDSPQRSCGPQLFKRVNTLCNENINVENNVSVSKSCCESAAGCTDDWIKKNVCTQHKPFVFRPGFY
ncbi:INSulin related [Caenorhabditis elegans]|uniref:INSulin related n=1 Tax=Caenorhabditis elegans TaxID=6239 RepID=Q9TZF3_CAEEL|nr:INSulin related [Caenorhabditis elegans]CCD73597.1 INSulin related [Caenorhabditis elegans]|eukprot:NP_494454.1 INSulin related [Caenorhabditis elegans]